MTLSRLSVLLLDLLLMYNLVPSFAHIHILESTLLFTPLSNLQLLHNPLPSRIYTAPLFTSEQETVARSAPGNDIQTFLWSGNPDDSPPHHTTVSPSLSPWRWICLCTTGLRLSA